MVIFMISARAIKLRDEHLRFHKNRIPRRKNYGFLYTNLEKSNPACNSTSFLPNQRMERSLFIFHQSLRRFTIRKKEFRFFSGRNCFL